MHEFSRLIENKFRFFANRNQLRDLERLAFEIAKREVVTVEAVLDDVRLNGKVERVSGRDRFFVIKEALIRRRYPLSSAHAKLEPASIFLPKVRHQGLRVNWQVTEQFRPLKIFVEKGANNSQLFKRMVTAYPQAEVEELVHYGVYAKKNKFDPGLLKQPIVFIVKENWDFIKPCPCTPGHVSCGYWILNIGFGCPFDCSYCFLQQYSNFPGVILPANLEDFFDKFDQMGRTLKRPIRIGTGEFCDSLALDEITQYSKLLIPYFKNKHVLFELKTKSDKVENILSQPASENIVISWSLNPDSIARTEERGAASLLQRLDAAAKVKEKGFKVGFHFDPIIYSSDWFTRYQEMIDILYARLRPPFAWISIGSLRGNRELKVASEMRFPDSKIFYGELLLGEDKKLRYPKFLRADMYRAMVGMLRRYDTATPLYLCMEDKSTWAILEKSDPVQIERYLIGGG